MVLALTFMRRAIRSRERPKRARMCDEFRTEGGVGMARSPCSKRIACPDICPDTGPNKGKLWLPATRLLGYRARRQDGQRLAAPSLGCGFSGLASVACRLLVDARFACAPSADPPQLALCRIHQPCLVLRQDCGNLLEDRVEELIFRDRAQVLALLVDHA